MLFPVGFRPKKSLGQSFLISQKIADKLVSALELKKSDKVLEIGAGTGILTTRLCEKADKVYAIEIDERLIPILKKNCQDFRNIEIIHQDIMTLDWQKFSHIKIISNIPYYLSSEILMTLLENIRVWDSAVLTTQREFTNKLLAKPSDKSYCLMTVLFDFLTERKKIISIPASFFRPSPKITSTAIIIKKRTSPLFNDIQFSDFYKVVNACFSYPRKTIANNLSLVIDIDKNKIAQIKNLDLTRRARTFSIQEFYKLTKFLCQ